MKLNCAHPLRAWYFSVSLGSRIPATAPVQPWVNQGMPEISLSSRAVKGVLTVIENEMCVVVFFLSYFVASFTSKQTQSGANLAQVFLQVARRAVQDKAGDLILVHN